MTLTALGRVLDYSARVLTSKEIRQAGYQGAVRYLPKPSPSSVATLTTAEYRDLTGAGLFVAVVFEHNDRLRPLEGGAAGVQDAKWAHKMALQEGIPVPPRTIFMAHDIWEDGYLSGAPLQKLRDYQEGAQSVLGGAAGVYGFAPIIQATFDDGTASRFWQCGRESDVLPHVNLYQQNYGQVTVGGIGCDVNKILTPDYGQHPAPAGAASAITHPGSEDDGMYLIHEQGGSRYCLLQGGRLYHLLTMDAVNDIRKAAQAVMEWPTKEIDAMLKASR